ncbi:ABC transporter ATP-binding protein [Alkalihalobacillus sp. MEB130]|uniref:sulfate/molybdate ABC transporter ATP-binding protein n=1 Tax=Alkalihalobacillus sp. MEB130 TaxID=2976704 RepID=UPI0028DFDB29|nr:ABC transporter ATP-binding protein [Alkalihalobacillus sp. MEB130]MDT8861952.1 ABC transporter ATP-binding protein [Alkalihalobacillus sp. MEB130]
MLKVSITKKLHHFKLTSQFEVGSGITGIIGPSGCGKSVTLQCIAGLQTPDTGEIVLGKDPLFQADQRINVKTKNRKIGYVFQNYALFPHLTVQQNIAYGLKIRNKEEKQRKVADMLKKVQLTGYEKHYPNELSGGQQQRVALARTLVTEPEILLLDEPFSALDHHVKHLLEEELLHIIKKHFTGVVLLVTHNMEEAYRLCDHLLLYHNGTIVQTGTKDEVFKKPTNIAAATIIGCKNILPVHSFKKVNNNHILCDLNGINLHVKNQPYPPHANAIGIHAENIQFVEQTNDTHNTFDYKVVDIVRGIHHSDVTIQVNKLSLKATISNHQVASVTNGTMKVNIPEDDLFILE